MRPAVKASKPAPPAWQYVPVASPCVPLLAPSRPALAHGGAARGEGAPRTKWTPPPRLGPAQSPHHEPAGCRQSRATRVRTQDFYPPQLLAARRVRAGLARRPHAPQPRTHPRCTFQVTRLRRLRRRRGAWKGGGGRASSAAVRDATTGRPAARWLRGLRRCAPPPTRGRHVGSACACHASPRAPRPPRPSRRRERTAHS